VTDQDLSALKAPELRELAKSLGIEKVVGVKNEVLREQIAEAQKAAADSSEPDAQRDTEGEDAGAPPQAEDPKGETYANGVFVPDGVEPGKTPGWPLYETEGGDWLPLDLTDEQRAALSQCKLDSNSQVPAVEPIIGEGRKLVLDDQGDYIVVETDPENDQPDTDERHGIDVPADGVATTLSEDGAEREITRENDSAWWCPFCDTSMLHGINRCPKCGSVREGDLAVKR
jgi:hypothetical protein